ncbi:MAG: hypothetical protein RMK29_06885 [Myxococcales bacterium]|nr:hypothetical protein [Myxococcota bacterium]MDW8281418.1 hypothetical protein [Myxococcales bacterium]
MYRPARKHLLRWVPLALAVWTGCEGGGVGAVSGQLYLRGCPLLERDGASAKAPAWFDLEPAHMTADTIRSAAISPSSDVVDARIRHRMIIRLQRSSHRAELTDGFSLFLTDVDALRAAAGRPVEVSAPSLDGPYAPLPAANAPMVRAAIWLNGSCPMAHVRPLLRGTALFRELGFEPGQMVEGEFAVAVEDPRGERQGLDPDARAAAGALSGFFQLTIRRGRSVTFP